MKYEAPKLTALSAIDAIQQTSMGKSKTQLIMDQINPTLPRRNEPLFGYADWE